MIRQELAQTRTDPRQRFPTPINSLEDMPPGVRAIVQQRGAQPSVLRLPPKMYPIRRTVWRVELPFGWRLTPERFLLFDQDTITIIETDAQGHTTTLDVALADLIKIHLVTILLHSYLELVWVDEAHVKVKRIEYNSVGHHLIEYQLNRLRALYPPGLSPAGAENRETILAPLPFKFRNYLRSSLVKEERLLAAVFQPAIWQKTRRFRACVAPNRAVGVTDRCLILIEDRQHKRSSDCAMLEFFYPLSQIQHIAVETTPDVCWVRLQHHAAGVTQQTDIPLLPDQLNALRGVLSAFRAQI